METCPLREIVITWLAAAIPALYVDWMPLYDPIRVVLCAMWGSDLPRTSDADITPARNPANLVGSPPHS